MNTLGPPISTFFQASNGREYETVAKLFTESATVTDEGRTHRGQVAIRDWAESTQKEYAFSIDPLESKRQGNSTVVTCEVSGGFPGSPINLHFAFVLEGDKIEGLVIGD